MATDPDEIYRRDGRKRSSKGDLKKETWERTTFRWT